MRYGLEDAVIRDITDVFASYPEVDEVILYGSRAKGNHKPGSDIDLTLKGKLGLAELNRIRMKLDDLCLPYTFDLSIYQYIREQDICDHIARVGIVLYRKPNGDN